jgi:chemotaxis protein MotB
MASRLIITAIVLFSLTGCVAQEKYGALKIERDALAEQLGESQVAAAAARDAAAAYKSQLDLFHSRGGDTASLLAQYTKENGELRGQLEAMKTRYEAALEKRDVVVNVLPQGLQNELQQFANANPELVEFDAARGILRFRSDVTFARGSAELTPQARQAISRFAQILNGPAARNYEFLVAGHTDSTPVTNPATIKAGHLDNWYLSSHRAISVGRELGQQGVSQRRLGVVGYADQRPVASNATPSGQTRNRRVEVAILPTTINDRAIAVDVSPAGRPAAGPASPARRPALDLNKDSTVDTRSLLNK